MATQVRFILIFKVRSHRMRCGAVRRRTQRTAVYRIVLQTLAHPYKTQDNARRRTARTAWHRDATGSNEHSGDIGISNSGPAAAYF